MIRTVTLETAKTLKEMGFKQDTYAWWAIGCDYKFDLHYPYHDKTKFKETYAAPYSDELLEKLPVELTFFSNKYILRIVRVQEGYSVYYFYSNDSCYPIKSANTLPEALAEMWIYLKKESLLNLQRKD